MLGGRSPDPGFRGLGRGLDTRLSPARCPSHGILSGCRFLNKEGLIHLVLQSLLGQTNTPAVPKTPSQGGDATCWDAPAALPPSRGCQGDGAGGSLLPETPTSFTFSLFVFFPRSSSLGFVFIIFFFFFCRACTQQGVLPPPAAPGAHRQRSPAANFPPGSFFPFLFSLEGKLDF